MNRLNRVIKPTQTVGLFKSKDTQYFSMFTNQNLFSKINFNLEIEQSIEFYHLR